MKAVLLCPGESLRALDAFPLCDVSMAVNRAALMLHGLDWWAASDYPTIRDHRERVTAPNLLSIQQTIADLGDRLKQFSRVMAYEDTGAYCPPELKADTYTATRALVALAFMGATEIHVYGADWKGTQDYDGKEAGENRTVERWARESFLWEGIVEWLSGKGVEVHRHIGVTA